MVGIEFRTARLRRAVQREISVKKYSPEPENLCFFPSMYFIVQFRQLARIRRISVAPLIVP